MFQVTDLRTVFQKECVCVFIFVKFSINISPKQGRIKLFGAPKQWKHFRPLFQAVFLSGGRYYLPDWVKYHASQSQDRNNKYFILYIEFCINNKI